MAENENAPKGIVIGLVQKFLHPQLSIMLIIFSICVGIAAILVTPREEEPQIVVPVADIFVQAPGASPEEIEKLAAAPLERLLWQIDGVEYVYSVSRQDMAVVTVRFYVGEDRENSLIKLHNKIAMNIDMVPPIVKGWVIKPVEIDDVPIVNLTLYSDVYDDHHLRRIGEEVLARLSEVKNISKTEIAGGRKREIRVELLPERMTGFGVSMSDVRNALQGADASVTAGTFSRVNREFIVTSDAFLSSAADAASLMVGVHKGRPVYIRDIAEVIDGPEEFENYTRIAFSNYYRNANRMEGMPESFPAVTLGIAKKKGTNAVEVSRSVIRKFEELRRTIIPDGVYYEITRNNGSTAQQKVNELLSSLAFAIITVVILMMITLGWREAIVVALAVPISFALALFMNYLMGYTINRVTLFALILSLGLVVDDPIINVDNIQRHILMKKRSPDAATLFAVQEILPPVIMSTLAIIVCFTPLFFITGMMGPYMAPMAANVPLTVMFSTLCALTIVPWLSHTLLKDLKPKEKTNAKKGTEAQKFGVITRVYRFAVTPFLESRLKRYVLTAAVGVMLLASCALGFFRMVPLKMLPFDNKNEFQIILDMPEGTTLEHTDGVVRAFEDYLRTIPEATNFISYVGNSSPIDFNGMVRHYYLRKGSHLADIRVNLADKSDRKQQSHEIVLRIRRDLEAVAREAGGNIQIVEAPPGPPVLSTIVAEVYGKPDAPYHQLIESAQTVKQLMAEEPFVVDIDDSSEAPHERINFVLDKEKAALHGVSTAAVIDALRNAVGGDTPATVHIPGERQPLMVKTILPREKRSGVAALAQIPIKTAAGDMIPLAELVHIGQIAEKQPIYHKNLERVVFVTAEMAGRAPAEAIIDMQGRLKKGDIRLPEDVRVEWAGEGEWRITIEVFRDMGIAFAAALVGIYILLVVETNSFFMPLLLMIAIPLTVLGIMPGFWLLNLITGNTVGGFNNPVFFTATSMIGMIALGGIVIRNSLVLINFIEESVKTGMAFKEAILQSGAIRMRPILLTAATTALGAWPITLDPVFSGLAWSLIFGLFASTMFTLLIIPVAYYALYRKKYAQA